jgi:hypothetical protein|tara:strand:- start:474 stop:1133 length:660 start_codon:yes stop_codon:yes gene_type:complete
MSFAGASFAESPFASQGATDKVISLTGFGITATLGNQSVVAVGSPVVAVSGFEAVMTFGATGVVSGGNAEITVQSIPFTMTLGTGTVVDASVTITATGFPITMTDASVDVLPQGVAEVTGIPISLYVNQVDVLAIQNNTISVTGFPITMTDASVSVESSATIIPTSIIAQLDLGTGTVIDLSALVTPTGLEIEVDEGILAPIGWTIVDDSSTMVWQKVA